MLLPLNSRPGIQRDGTQAAAEAHLDGQWVRFQRGLPRKMGGFSWLEIAAFAGTPRLVYVDVRDGGSTAYVFTDQGAYSLRDLGAGYGAPVDHDAQLPSGVGPMTWTASTMFSGIGGSAVIVSLPVRDSDNIAKEVTGQLLYGLAGELTPFFPVEDEDGDPVEGSGTVCLQPFTVVYGNDGLLRNSNANDISAASGWVQGGGNYALTANVMGSRVVAGMAIQGGGASPAGLFWGINEFLKMSFVGGQRIWQYDTLSSKISIAGRNSVIEVDGVYYWVGVDKFYVYDGQVKELPNTFNTNWFFDGLNWPNRNKMWAAKVPRFGEIWWFYPRGDATECSHAVIYNYKENAWYDAVLVRSAGDYDLYNGHPLWAGPSAFNVLNVHTTLNVIADSAAAVEESWPTEEFEEPSVGSAAALDGGMGADGFPYFVGFDGSGSLFRANSVNVVTGVLDTDTLTTPRTAIDSVEIDDADETLYIGSAGTSTLHKSANNGDTWGSALNFAPVVSEGDVSVSDGAVAVVGNAANAAVSEDAGATWDTVNTVEQMSKTAVAGSTVLFTPEAESDGPYKMSLGDVVAVADPMTPPNNGEVWQLGPGEVIGEVGIDWMRANGNFALAASSVSPACYISVDGCDSFNAGALPGAVLYVRSAISSAAKALVTSGTVIYSSVDAGATWSPIMDPGVAGAMLSADTDNAGNWLGAKSSQMLRSLDDLATFSNPASPAVGVDRVVYTGAGIWLAHAGTSTVYRCTDITLTVPVWVPVALPSSGQLYSDRFGNVLLRNGVSSYVSHNNGLTWGATTLSPTPSAGTGETYTAALSATAWMVSYLTSFSAGSAVFSTDGGATWVATLSAPPDGYGRYMSYSDGKYLCLPGLFPAPTQPAVVDKTSDEGDTWSRGASFVAATGISELAVFDDTVVVLPTGDTEYVASLDGGVTWVPTSIPSGPGSLARATTSPSTGAVVLGGAAVTSAIYRAPSIDGVFSMVSPTGNRLFASWLDSQVVMCGSPGGFDNLSWPTSVDGGITWLDGACAVPDGVAGMGVVANNTLLGVAAGVNIVVGSDGFVMLEDSFTSSIAGESLATVYADNVFVGGGSRRATFNTTGKAMLVSQSNNGLSVDRNGRWAAVYDAGGMLSGGEMTLARNSATGVVLVSGAFPSAVCRIGASVTSPAGAFDAAGCDPVTSVWLRDLGPTTVDVSVDDAATWNTVASTGGTTSAVIAGNDGTWIAVTVGDTVLRSVDDGATWAPVSAPTLTGVVSVDYSDNIWYMLSSIANGVLVSVDDGVTWAFVTGTVPASSHLEAGGGRVLVSGANGVWRSDDVGTTWVQSTSVPLLYASTDKSGNWVSPGVGTGAADAPYHSEDNGVTWVPYATSASTGGGSAAVTGGVLPSGVCVLPTANSLNLLVSEDAGYTWDTVPTVGVPSFPAVLLVAQDGRVLLSSTVDGDTWYTDDLVTWVHSDTEAADGGAITNVGYSATYGLFATSNQSAPLWSPLTDVLYKWADVAADSDGHVVLLAAVGAVAVSDDNGATWALGFMPGGRLSSELWVSIKYREGAFYAVRGDQNVVYRAAASSMLTWAAYTASTGPQGDGAWVAAVGSSDLAMSIIRAGTTTPVFKATALGGAPDAVAVTLFAPPAFDPDGYQFNSEYLDGLIISHDGPVLYVEGTLVGYPGGEFPAGINLIIGELILGQEATAVITPLVGGPIMTGGPIVSVLESGVVMRVPDDVPVGTYASAMVTTDTGSAESVGGVFVGGAAYLARHEQGVNEVRGEEVTALQSSFTTHEMSMVTMAAQFQGVDPAQQTRVNKVVPDFTQVGTITAEVMGRDYPQQTATVLASVDMTTEPFYTLQAQKGRLRFRFTSNEVDGFFESGIQRGDLSPGDARASGA